MTTQLVRHHSAPLTVFFGEACPRQDSYSALLVTNAAALDPFIPPPQELEVCPICCEAVPSLIHHSCCAVGHSCCTSCLSRWVNAQLPQCMANKQLRTTCPFCSRRIPQHTVLEVSTAAADLAQKLERRFKLENIPLYPPAAQAECPNVECVGIGYLGFETVMCFLCEEQWPAAGRDPDGLALPDVIKACPGCGVKIEKTGGCDHMVCRLCEHEFWWTTLAPYRRLPRKTDEECA